MMPADGIGLRPMVWRASLTRLRLMQCQVRRRASDRSSLARSSAAESPWAAPAIGSRSREHREWHLPTRADWSFAGGQFQQVLASAIPETSIRHQSYRLQSEARRADIAGE